MLPDTCLPTGLRIRDYLEMRHRTATSEEPFSDSVDPHLARIAPYALIDLLQGPAEALGDEVGREAAVQCRLEHEPLQALRERDDALEDGHARLSCYGYAARRYATDLTQHLWAKPGNSRIYPRAVLRLSRMGPGRPCGTRLRALPPVAREFVYPAEAEPRQCVTVLWFFPQALPGLVCLSANSGGLPPTR